MVETLRCFQEVEIERDIFEFEFPGSRYREVKNVVDDVQQ